MMDKVDLKSGEVIAKEAAFHCKTEFHSVVSLDLHAVKYEPLRGSSYIMEEVPLVVRFQGF